MPCSLSSLVVALSCLQVALGLLHLALHRRRPLRYGKHEEGKKPREAGEREDAAERKPPPPPPPPPPTRTPTPQDGQHLPARSAWFLQELPACLVPALLLAWRNPPRLAPLGCKLLAGMFCTHYFYRTFIYSFLTRGRPFPLKVLFFGILFCTYNGFLQGYYMIYCAEYPDDWCNNLRFTSGLMLFLFGLGINIHSDHVLRQLRKPGEFTYKIPQGGLFDYVSGANFFGEILEWFGYAIATWSLPALTFAIFTLCCIGPRAVHHHRSSTGIVVPILQLVARIPRKVPNKYSTRASCHLTEKYKQLQPTQLPKRFLTAFRSRLRRRVRKRCTLGFVVFPEIHVRAMTDPTTKGRKKFKNSRDGCDFFFFCSRDICRSPHLRPTSSSLPVSDRVCGEGGEEEEVGGGCCADTLYRARERARRRRRRREQGRPRERAGLLLARLPSRLQPQRRKRCGRAERAETERRDEAAQQEGGDTRLSGRYGRAREAPR
ncbi:hypothetical protein JRQ81_008677 [Phrynocephalus forsythii]|uniref:3-oxo-5-alpha-steroid 4-dehydrogenase C-terminal domain-containing protein n=1 Tax=Phrynocephalus forsythii TaxID=171643 RepID=A0A9Q0Y459_9SAUR|nr:hypothetical protein JRQ81_008677 [Phrynocephalus forsythii]